MPARIRVKHRHPISKRDRKRLEQRFTMIAGRIRTASNVEMAKVELNGNEYYVLLVEGQPEFVLHGSGDHVEPLLCALVRNPGLASKYPNIIVDRGAAKALARGANLMIPGVRAVNGSFDEGALVVIIDEESGIPVALGRATLPSNELAEKASRKAKGLAVVITQRPGDNLWELCTYLSSRKR